MTENSNQFLKHNDSSPFVSRRRLLKHGGAAFGAAALLSGNQLATAAEGESDRKPATNTELRVDVACDGNTLRINRIPGGDPDAAFKRGDTFVVGGRMFPEGTIEEGLDSPDQEGSIGTWVCRGWFFHDLIDIVEDEAVPHEVTSQVFLFDNYDGLNTDGMEGGIQTIRAITGGHGAFTGARGECVETPMGSNDTNLHLGGGIVLPAFNFHFDFRIMM